jgi:hypothetical protein
LLLTSPILPTLYDAADAASLAGQRWFLLARRTQLIAFVVAAGAGALTVVVGSYDLAGVVALVAFAVVLATQVLLDKFDPQRIWYEGRMAAESIKHLAWKYAVRADPFVTDEGADALLIARLNETREAVSDLALPAAGPDQITSWMKEVRASPFETRRAVYLEKRVEDQRAWYSRRSGEHAHTAWQWRIVLYTTMIVGTLAGIGKALTLISLDFVGVAATAASGITAWVESKQFSTLVVAYAQASHELAGAHSLGESVADDAESWSKFVNDSEDAISREHRMWAASRTAKASLIAGAWRSGRAPD